MTKQTKAGSAKGRKNLNDLLMEGVIKETGKDAAGRHMANVSFPDGTLGGIGYEELRTMIVEQGRVNRDLLASLGYKQGLVCVAGLHGGSHWEKEGKPTLTIDGTYMNRIREIQKDGTIRELSTQEKLVMWVGEAGAKKMRAAMAKIEGK